MANGVQSRRYSYYSFDVNKVESFSNSVDALMNSKNVSTSQIFYIFRGIEMKKRMLVFV